MAKNSIRDYDATSGNNTDVQSVDISEGCAASGINNALREIMADLKNVSTGTVSLETPAADSLTVAGDLTVDTTTLKVDSSNNRVLINTDTEGLADYADTLTVADTDHAGITIRSGASSSGSLYFSDATSGSGEYDGFLNYNQSTQKLTVGTAATTRLSIDSTGTASFEKSDAITVIDRVGTNVAGIKTGSGDDFCVGTADYPQAIRIKNATGRVGISQTAPTTPFHVYQSGGDICTVQTGRTDTSNVGMIVFRDGDAQTCGQITSRGNDNTTSYNTSSDHRLKQSVTDMTGAIDRVKAMLPKRFSFINDTTNTMQDGFLAHEAQTVVPQSVIGTHNETREVSNAVLLANGKLYAEDVTQSDWTANKGDDENDLYPSDSTWAASHTAPVYQQIDHSKLVPLLTGALKEAIAKIETLETEMTALKARVTALEA